jgi:hypothetical protein
LRALAWVLCALGLLALAVALAPAALLDTALSVHTKGAARLADAHGTIWRGSGTVTASDGSWRIPLGWSLHAGPLLHGAIQVELHPLGENDVPNGQITIARSNVELRQLNAALPAASLQTFLQTRNPFTLSGDILVQSPALRWDGNAGAGTADVRWQQAGAAVNALRLDLGSVSARLNVDGSELRGTFNNAGGEVALSGNIAGAAHSLAIEADLRPTPNAPPWIAAAISAFGALDAQGNVHLTWRATP